MLKEIEKLVVGNNIEITEEIKRLNKIKSVISNKIKKEKISKDELAKIQQELYEIDTLINQLKFS
jgi:hypothetical protein